MAGTKKSAKAATRPSERTNARLYTLDVHIMRGPISESFGKKNPVLCRTIQIRGNQTLQDLHFAIFAAFDREEEHLYEFQFGKRPIDPNGPRYVMPHPLDFSFDDGGPLAAGQTDKTTIDSLGLQIRSRFAYWFDFGDDWWHQINVEAIEDAPASGKYPKVTKKVGKSPPQYPDWEE